MGSSGLLLIPARLSLKCRPRHLHHPKGRSGWCHILIPIRGFVSRRDLNIIDLDLQEEERPT